ncbi:MAG: hypothetical protein A2020_13100 [Lentisphaerae bacterium GWF2_45_14]|nr:MAG: hypothetical protein A2020_13100 [Lentisphaerae bacterium GWF2_45_14]
MKKLPPFEKLRSYLKENGKGFTLEREEMLKVILSMKGTYSAEDFYKAAFKKKAIHDRSTVYRGLSIFADAGFVEVSRLPNGRKDYETKH